jgi:hypothetical protein
VAGGFPERLVEDQGRLDFGVAGREQHSAHVVGERVVERGALAHPERRAGRPLVEHEQAEVLAEFAMVALLGFFNPNEVLFEVLVLEKRSAVDALHRGALGVTLPVRIRRVEHLECLELRCARHVRAHAEVHKRVAVLDGVTRHVRLAGGLLLDQLHLERFAAFPEELDGLVAQPHLAFKHQVLGRQFLHPLFDLLEIPRQERAVDHEVVEEAFVSGRTDAALGLGKQLGDRRGEQVGGGVPIDVHRIGAVGRHDAQAHVAGQGEGQVHQRVVDIRGQGFLDHAGRQDCPGKLDD